MTDRPSTDYAAAGRSMMKTTVFLLSSLVVAPAAAGQERATPGDGERAFASRVADNTIDVDGLLDEPAWEQEAAIDDFVQKEPIEAAQPTERMTIRFACDASALYVGARMYKNPGSRIQAPMGRLRYRETAPGKVFRYGMLAMTSIAIFAPSFGSEVTGIVTRPGLLGCVGLLKKLE
jgi:hypothetical protein